jgi:hypothetical protein
MTRRFFARLAVALFLLFVLFPPAQGKGMAAKEVAEFLFQRFGAKAGPSVPALATQIEKLTVRYGDDALLAAKRGGPGAARLVEEAGEHGAQAVRLLVAHGEQGAARVLSRPAAMKQFLRHGDEAAVALCRHPGVAEPLIEKGGSAAVKALAKVEPQAGRRLAMLLEKEVADASRHHQLFGVVERYGERAVSFLWENKAALAGGAALAAFLADPEPFLTGTRDILSVTGEAVVKPVTDGVVSVLTATLVGIVVVLAGVGVLIHKHGPPKADTVKHLLALWRK